MSPNNQRSDGTTTYSILQAFECLNQQASSDVAPPADVVATVVDISGANDKVHLKIVDPSLVAGATAYVNLPARRYAVAPGGELVLSHSKQQQNSVEVCSVGDVVRFNRLALVQPKTKFSSAENHDAPPIFEFFHAWNNPDNGQELCRLCHLGTTAEASLEPVDPKAVPASHATDDSFLQGFLSWYQSSDVYARLRKHRQQKLAPLPSRHQQRSLAELQACVGVVGDTVPLTVSTVRTQALGNNLGHKRQKRSAAGHQACGTLALLHDNHGHQMTLLDADNRFTKVLREAVDLRRPVQLVSAQSCRAAEIHCLGERGMNCDFDGEVLLVCGADTKVTLLASGSLSAPSASSLPLHSQPSHPALTTTAGENALSAAAPNENRRRVRAAILELFINGGVVDRKTSVEQAAEIVASDSANDDKSFPQAKLLLLVEEDTTTFRMIVVARDGAIVQMLCGGVEWDEFLTNRDLREKAARFLLCLLTKDVRLDWELSGTNGVNGNCLVAEGVRLSFP